MSLEIYRETLSMVREVYEVAKVVERVDGDLARQMRRSGASVPLNVSEGTYSRKGNRLARWRDAMGSANDTLFAARRAWSKSEVSCFRTRFSTGTSSSTISNAIFFATSIT
ncbi:MAG: four helix bundle protein [Myxococcales bacterium]